MIQKPVTEVKTKASHHTRAPRNITGDPRPKWIGHKSEDEIAVLL